ncbi:MAG TPA: heavy-metal-associated domain-containing protein [Ignavibacteriaceae bacterium]|nr:heavy-metal-associated domain-containing protein [Ignavibacteriaceae bacterium]
MTKKFKIEGMSCGHCVMAVKKELSRIDADVKDVQIGSAVVDVNGNITEEKIKEAIENAGYNVTNVEG